MPGMGKNFKLDPAVVLSPDRVSRRERQPRGETGRGRQRDRKLARRPRGGKLGRHPRGRANSRPRAPVPTRVEPRKVPLSGTRRCSYVPNMGMPTALRSVGPNRRARIADGCRRQGQAGDIPQAASRLPAGSVGVDKGPRSRIASESGCRSSAISIGEGPGRTGGGVQGAGQQVSAKRAGRVQHWNSCHRCDRNTRRVRPARSSLTAQVVGRSIRGTA